MFGVYFHDLVSHGGLMLRLVSGQSANAEEEERQFNQHQKHYKKVKQLQPHPTSSKCASQTPSRK